MFRDGRIKLDDVRNREVGSNKPAATKDPQTLSTAFLDGAVDENCEQE